MGDPLKPVVVEQRDKLEAARLLGYRDVEDMYDYRLTGLQERERDKTVQSLAAHRQRAIEEVVARENRLRSALQPFADLGKRKAQYCIQPHDPIILEAIRALAR